MDKTLRKWIGWFEEIKADVTALLISQNMFWEVNEIIKKNKKLHAMPDDFYRYLGQTYTAYICLGIRRQVKSDKDSISLKRLLEEIIQRPSLFSRDYFKDLYKGSNVENRADRDFNRLVGKEKDFISVEMVQEDLISLVGVSKKIENFADKKIAHMDKRGFKKIPTFSEVDECIEKLDNLCQKYELIFHARAVMGLMPTYQYNWAEVFTIPWIEGDI